MNYIPEFIEVLSGSGWVPVDKCTINTDILLLNKKYKVGYLKPKLISEFSYKGVLLEIETDSCTMYCKPSSYVWCNDTKVQGKDIKKGDLMNRSFMWHKVDKVDKGVWEGKMFDIFFGIDLLMPVRFETDYWLITV